MKFKPIKALQALSVVATLVLFSGCAHYKAQPLDRMLSNRNTSFAKENHISLDYHVFNKTDCKRYLNRDVISAGYQPIHISFNNNTDRYLHVTMSNFSLPVTIPEEIAEEFHTSTIGRATGYGVAAFFVWPFAIPAIVDGVKSSKANKQLSTDYSRKSFRDCVVSPYSSVDGLIFVPIHAFNGNFSLKVMDRNNNEQFTLSSTNPYYTIAPTTS